MQKQEQELSIQYYQEAMTADTEAAQTQIYRTQCNRLRLALTTIGGKLEMETEAANKLGEEVCVRSRVMNSEMLTLESDVRVRSIPVRTSIFRYKSSW